MSPNADPGGRYPQGIDIWDMDDDDRNPVPVWMHCSICAAGEPCNCPCDECAPNARSEA